MGSEPLSLNLESALAPMRAKLQNEQRASVLVIGDSLSFRTGSYLPYLREHLQMQYGDGGAGYQGYSIWTGAGLNQGWVRGFINQNTPPHHSLDGLWASSQSSPFPPLHTHGTFEALSSGSRLHYLVQPGGGSFDLTHPDQSVQTISTNGPEGVGIVEQVYVGNERTSRIQPLGDGWITILGQDNFETGPGIVVHRAANGGWGVTTFLTRDGSFDDQVSLLAPDLVIIWLGQNDQGISQTNYAVLMEQLADRILLSAPGAGVILVGTYNSGGASLRHLVAAMHSVAASRDFGFINIHRAGGDYRWFLANGYLDDGVHFSEAGGAYLGQMMFDAIMSDGASLTQGPCWANCDGSTTPPVLNVEDLTCFINLFAAGDPLANCDGSTTPPVLNIEDFTCFINAFAAGCSS